MQGKRSDWRPPRHIRERWRARDKRLRELGFASYDSYLASVHWRTVKARYRASGLPQRCVCGEARVEFHHKTYERLGAEELTDIEPLCTTCHHLVHVLDRRGELRLDFRDLASDERAAQYAADAFTRQRAQRQAAALDREQQTRAERRAANSARRAARKQRENDERAWLESI